MHELKVGQVWKWYEHQVATFKVLEVGEETATIAYTTCPNNVLTYPLTYWDGATVLVKDVEELVETENNQLSPNVYQFPNGVEVKDISAHLTSFGGQAVQYIARATRLDGVVKGLPIQDLYKAIELLKWEAERMEALEESK